MYKLQDVYLKPIKGNEQIENMYYRGNDKLCFVLDKDGASLVEKDSFFETFTYFGSLSVEKWSKYTFASKFYLVLKIEGSFDITLFGHYVEHDAIKKEFYGNYRYDNSTASEVVIPYPISLNSQVVAFSVTARSDLKIYESYYSADLEKNSFSNPFVSLVTTTFKKEKYIKRNILLLKEELFYTSEFKNRFNWFVIDNGRTLEESSDGCISVIHNKNVGGAGGFARGMIEALKQKRKPSHILLMDDDVNVNSDSFKRVYRLLNILRDEYKNYFISGAMLNLDAPNIQHENTGVIKDEGFCVPLQSGRDLRLWDQVVLNESINDSITNRYAAWWFCCIPTTVARLDNLPLPLFVRGDDIEYSIRNHARFITMNGISIWHQGFAGKSNPVMDLYQSKRNELIINAIRPELSEVKSFRFIEELFWQEIYKFNYDGANLISDAIEDFMKGPEWLVSNDLFEQIQLKRDSQSKTYPITNEIHGQIDYSQLFTHRKISRIKKFIYDYSFNGQARIPSLLLRKKTGVIPYSGGYYPDKQLLTSTNIAVDVANDRYALFKRNRSKFKTSKNDFYL